MDPALNDKPWPSRIDSILKDHEGKLLGILFCSTYIMESSEFKVLTIQKAMLLNIKYWMLLCFYKSNGGVRFLQIINSTKQEEFFKIMTLLFDYSFFILLDYYYYGFSFARKFSYSYDYFFVLFSILNYVFNISYNS